MVFGGHDGDVDLPVEQGRQARLRRLQHRRRAARRQLLAEPGRGLHGPGRRRAGHRGVRIKSGRDLKGKTIATRVGSTGSWFVSEYLKAHGLKDSDVTIKNMDPHIMPSAIDRGDIDAFFVWEPYGAQALKIAGSRVHKLITPKGYLNGYLVIGAWTWYVRDHPGVAERMLKAIDRPPLGRRAHGRGHPVRARAVQRAGHAPGWPGTISRSSPGGLLGASGCGESLLLPEASG